MSRAVEAEISLQATPRRALAAFLDPTDLRGWWGVERALVQPQVNGLYALAWGISAQGFRYVTTGVVRKYVPERVLGISDYTYLSPERPILGPMGLTLSVEQRTAHESSSRVVQDGYQDGAVWNEYHAAVTEAWPRALKMLKEYLEHPAGK